MPSCQATNKSWHNPQAVLPQRAAPPPAPPPLDLPPRDLPDAHLTHGPRYLLPLPGMLSDLGLALPQCLDLALPGPDLPGCLDLALPGCLDLALPGRLGLALLGPDLL